MNLSNGSNLKVLIFNNNSFGRIEMTNFSIKISNTFGSTNDLTFLRSEGGGYTHITDFSHNFNQVNTQMIFFWISNSSFILENFLSKYLKYNF